MRRTTTITLAALLAVSLTSGAGGAELEKRQAEPAKAFERLETAMAAGGTTSPSGGFTAQEADDVGDATLRLWGQNRYATAAAFSEFFWSYEDTFAVFLATGENFPDALAAGPSTFYLGPLLLVRRDVLPEETRAELERLRPCFIIAAGGQGTISDEVLLEADQYTDDECFFEEEEIPQ